MRLTILDMQKIARRRGGQCLSKEYVRDNSNLTWQCSAGHKWEAVPNNIKRGRWCPTCASMRNGTIEEMQEMAKERGGQCLSAKYTNNQTKLTWKCTEGHQWETTPSHIRQGHWCPACAGNAMSTIEEMRRTAKSKGGRCLSKEYINARSRLTWQCKQGHQWRAVPGNIRSGKWCPVCAGTQTGSIEEMSQIARGRGGHCLSKEYINSRTKLTWQCKQGHHWKALPSSIKQGHWCAICVRQNR